MPDFERITDQLSVDLAKDGCDRSYKLGIIEGKIRARWEILIVACVIYFGIAAYGYFGPFLTNQ